MHSKGILILFAAMVALLTPSASRAQGLGQSDVVGGSVTAVDPVKKTVTVQGMGPTPRTFKISSSAVYAIIVPGKLSDAKIGDKIRVVGQPSARDANTIDARQIAVMPPDIEGFGDSQTGSGGVIGTVATVTPTLTVVSPNNRTYTIDASAIKGIGLLKPGGFADIAVGNIVTAQMVNGEAARVQISPIPAALLATAKWLASSLGGDSAQPSPDEKPSQVAGLNYISEDKANSIGMGSSLEDMYKAFGKPDLQKPDVKGMTDYYYLVQGGGLVVFLFDKASQTICGSRMVAPGEFGQASSELADDSPMISMSDDQFEHLAKKVLKEAQSGLQ